MRSIITSFMLALKVVLAVVAASIGFAASATSRTPSPESTLRQERKQHAGRIGTLYEDKEVKIPVPRGWRILKVGSPDDPLAAHPPAVPQSFIPSPGRGLLLSSRGYTLTLAYTGHGSPIIGGRFIEVFQIPWLEGIDDGWACGNGLEKLPIQTRTSLRFISLVLKEPPSQLREYCDLPENNAITNRWFGGYFTDSKGGWFFASENSGCPEKAYTLTSSAKTAAELPSINDPVLKKVIGEAIEIIGSIHYKRCPPARFPNSH